MKDQTNFRKRFNRLRQFAVAAALTLGAMGAARAADLPLWKLPCVIPTDRVGQYVMWTPGPADGSSPITDKTGFNNSANSTGAAALWNVGITGKGVTAVVVDGGFYTGHEIFNGGKIINNYLGGTDTHGTHVAGTVLGMAPDARLGLGNYFLDTDQSVTDAANAYTFNQIADLAAAYNIAAVNNSWEIPHPDYLFQFLGEFYATPAEAAAANPQTAAAVANLYYQGVASVMGTANNGINNKTGYPNGLPYAVSVGALNRYGIIHQFSNLYGDDAATRRVVLLAPGVNIYSAIDTQDGASYYGNMSGTSMAAPHVTGAIALLKSGIATASGAEIVNALAQTGDVVKYDPNELVPAAYYDGLLFGKLTDLADKISALGGTEDVSAYVDFLHAVAAELNDPTNVDSKTTAENWRTVMRLGEAYGRGTTPDAPHPSSRSEFLQIAAQIGALDNPLQQTEYRFIRVDKALTYLEGEHADIHSAALRDAGGKVGGAVAAAFADHLRNGGVTPNGHRIINRLDLGTIGQGIDSYRQMSPNFAAAALDYQQFIARDLAAQVSARTAGVRVSPSGRNPEFYIEGIGAYGDRAGTKNSSAWQAGAGGVVFGVNRKADWGNYGAFGAWTRQNLEGGDGESSMNSLAAGVNFGFTAPKFFADFVGSYNAGFGSMTRSIDFAGVNPANLGAANQYWLSQNLEYVSALHFRPQADLTAHNFALRLAGGYDWVARDGWYFGPRFESSAVLSHHQGFTERGGDILAVKAAAFNSYYLEDGAGLELAKVFATAGVGGNFIASAKVMGIYGAGFGDDITYRFSNNSQAFSVPVEHVKQMYAAPEVSLRWQVDDRLAIDATYRGRFGSKYIQYSGNLRLVLEF